MGDVQIFIRCGTDLVPVRCFMDRIYFVILRLKTARPGELLRPNPNLLRRIA